VKGGGASAGVATRRLDQWLWFARFFKSRSLAARCCIAGSVTVNGVAVRKSNHMLRIGDILIVPQGAFRRTVRLLGLGARRGPAVEARLLYEEIDAPARLTQFDPVWIPLIMVEDKVKNDS